MSHFAKIRITQQFSIARTPQKNGVIERRIGTLVEAARMMLIFSKASKYLWAEAVATSCFTQNHSLVHTRYNKTPYELIKNRKPNVQYFHVFGMMCYPTNDRDDIGMMKLKADISPLYDGYYAGRNQEVSTNSTARDIPNIKDTPSLSTSIVDDNEAPLIVSTSKEPTYLITNDIADESIQEDTADLDRIMFINPFCSPVTEEAESSSINQGLLYMH
nr:integrase, catalytic region, zinc finger, CCHC-type, peptidase aspartic, catalytic [Tanacetum cinerariifolium]